MTNLEGETDWITCQSLDLTGARCLGRMRPMLKKAVYKCERCGHERTWVMILKELRGIKDIQTSYAYIASWMFKGER